MRLDEALLRVAETCERHGIEYALAGGFAYAVYCTPRATVDIDIVAIGDPARLEAALISAFPTVYRNTVPMEYPLVRVHRFLLIDTDEEIVLDVLEPTRSSFGADVAAHTRTVDFHDRELRVVAPEHLYAMKRASSRRQDQLDADELFASVGETFDPKLVDRWVDRNDTSRD